VVAFLPVILECLRRKRDGDVKDEEIINQEVCHKFPRSVSGCAFFAISSKSVVSARYRTFCPQADAPFHKCPRSSLSFSRTYRTKYRTVTALTSMLHVGGTKNDEVIKMRLCHASSLAPRREGSSG
jgi:hypothetical protein